MTSEREAALMRVVEAARKAKDQLAYILGVMESTQPIYVNCDSECKSRIEELSDALPALDATGAAWKGVDAELLETARHAMSGLLAEGGRGTDGHQIQVASDAVGYARALHAALEAPR